MNEDRFYSMQRVQVSGPRPFLGVVLGVLANCSKVPSPFFHGRGIGEIGGMRLSILDTAKDRRDVQDFLNLLVEYTLLATKDQVQGKSFVGVCLIFPESPIDSASPTSTPSSKSTPTCWSPHLLRNIV